MQVMPFKIYYHCNDFVSSPFFQYFIGVLNCTTKNLKQGNGVCLKVLQRRERLLICKIWPFPRLPALRKIIAMEILMEELFSYLVHWVLRATNTCLIHSILVTAFTVLAATVPVLT